MAYKQFRKDRTRQLIQVGGNADLAGFLTELGIPADMDLQKDGPPAANFSAIILGLFLEATQRLQGKDRDILLMQWRMAGKEKFQETKNTDEK